MSTTTSLQAKIGVLLIATGRFRNLGADTAGGTYEQRKISEAQGYLQALSAFCTPVYSGTVYTREDLRQAMQRFTAEEVDGVFALFLSWSEDFAWVRFLRDMPPLPVMLACRTPDVIPFQNTFAETDFVDFLAYGGLVGTLEGSGSVKRLERPMLRTAVGTLTEIMAQTADFAAAAAVRSYLRRCSFGLLASYNEVMWSTYVDPYQFFASIGPELRFVSVLSLCNEIDAVPAEEAAAVCRTLSERYPVLPDVDPVFFEASIRASLGLDRLARKTGVQTLVLNDVDPVLFENVGLRPGFLPLPGREDLTVVPEGDVGGGLAVTILRLLSGRPVQFIEPFYIDLAADCFVGGHAGPNDYTDPASHVTIARDIRFAKTAYKYAGAPFAWFTIPAGRKTLLHLSETKGRFKMVCTEVDALETEPFITSYSHGRFRPVRGTVTELFARLAEIGVNQHYAVAPGDFLSKLTILAGLLDIDLTII